ncbi:MAG: 6-phosphofructokinase [Clostridium sp.]|uniref:6-phosphofructokinase n=1 Tax=Clostridium chrysemydis TaxID=2665504 RepID=UPI003EE6478A
MKNCIIAQSGGPTSVINSSLCGVLEGNKFFKLYDKVYGGLNGIEGILNNSIVDLTNLNKLQIEKIKHTPASFLGTCRYKMPSSKTSPMIYEKLISTLNKLDIKAVFYIGGNDSMDTVAKLSKYALENNYDIKFIGIPKTIDNDLFYMDHSPGFISACNYINTSIVETFLDFNSYDNDSIFILETMGRDTGWLAASTCICSYLGNPIVDLIYVPEVPFDSIDFITSVKSLLKTKHKVYIVVSEGIKDKNGNLISKFKYAENDPFGHIELGGVSNRLKVLLTEAGVKAKIRSLELSTLQRCAMHCVSEIDILESFKLGFESLKLSNENMNGFMVALNRISSYPYKTKIEKVEAYKVSNKTKYLPSNWINKENNNITTKAYDYFIPLLKETHSIIESKENFKIINL